MTIEARYFDKSQDFEEVGREVLEPGEFFYEHRTGQTPDGPYESLHVVDILDEQSIYGYVRHESVWGDEQNQEVVQREDINGAGWSFFSNPDSSNPNIGL